MGITSEIFIQPPREAKHVTGETIQGFVRFRLDTDTVYKTISLSLVEKGQCNFQATQDTMVQTTETILVQKQYFLFDDVTEHGNIKLSAGLHECPFQIIIPLNIPASVKTRFGEIKYHLVLKFKRPEMLSWNKTFKKKIFIHPRVESLLSSNRVSASLNKTLCSLFSSKKREISLDAVLDKEFLNPGREGQISFAVKNNSDVVVSIKTELLCKTNYTLPKSKKTFKKKKVVHFSTVETPKIPESSQISNMSSMIPVDPDICTVRYSNILNREYKLRVTLKVPCPHVNSSVEIPVFIGESVEENAGVEGEFNEPLEAPPTYWESMQEFKAAAVAPQKRM
ncbi:hypothetical protein PYW08_001963 [Mythimna loreyi]|uniref:Uncharacterized protein n=1 Tax=Mythimna loreyi TaxID=667449 RepID=A0ACC2R1D7_9NEOP|nr:hypothetical protein PYW08_001963 [Mythimna loreyi]